MYTCIYMRMVFRNRLEVASYGEEVVIVSLTLVYCVGKGNIV